MKHHNYDGYTKHRDQQWNQEHKAGGFRCSHCRQFVVINEIMGTANRNHCNMCLWSKHVDVRTGDRRAECKGGMQPIGLTYKHEGLGKIGELMFIHLCLLCGKIDINRVARDDPEHTILAIFEASLGLDDRSRQQIEAADIYLLGAHDREQLSVQLLGTLPC